MGLSQLPRHRAPGLPAFQVSKGDLIAWLHGGARDGAGGRRSQRLRSALVVTEMAHLRRGVVLRGPPDAGDRRAHALGAGRHSVLGLVVGQGMRLAAIGLVLGLVLALGVTRVLGSLLFEVKPADPATFAAVTAILAVVAFLASYLPGRRAASIDPIHALREE